MTDTIAAEPLDHEEHDTHGDHKPDWWYARVAIGLALITAVEVAWSYMGLTTVAEVGGLMFMMAVKFMIVAAFFMHLRFDNKMLTRIFYAGVFLAFAVYFVVLVTLRVFPW